jgi:20S proteasome alpha/beta subunit
MTWVIGGGVMTGYAIGLSDIRITLEDGSERDCLQKIYPVGPNIAAAFAGSVAIGFEMVQNLTELLHVPQTSEPVGFDPV